MIPTNNTYNTSTFNPPIFTDDDLIGPDIRIIDDLNRIKYNSSICQSILHFRERRQLNKQIEKAVFTFFQNRYHIEGKNHFKRIWKEIGHKAWDINTPLTVGRLRAIDDLFQKQLAYHGSGISSAPQLTNHPNRTIQQIVNALLHGGPINAKELIQKPLLQAVFIKKDHEWLKEFRNELQRELDHLFENPPMNEKDKIVWNGFLGNIIALIPFSYPLENDIIALPILSDDGSCRRVEYQVNVLELTPSSSTTPITALGLCPQNDSTAPPVLTFLGTTYPGGDGFAATLLADFTPGKSVGEAVYKSGHTKIDEWLKEKNHVHLVGTSLGGALAFHTLIHHQPKLSRVDVFNPPGLYENCWKRKKFNEGCEINIYNQAGDIVSRMGSWPTGDKVNIYNVIPHQKGVVEGKAASHAKVFTGCKKVTILRVKPEEDNNRFSRKVLTFMHRFLGPLLIYLPVSLMLCAHRISNAINRRWQSIRQGMIKVNTQEPEAI